MPYAHARDADLYYEVHGRTPGDAPVLVFAHGAGGNRLSWWQQVPHFRDRYCCLIFDHRGFGQSHERTGGPDGAAFADDLRALLDAAGITRATLIAQSMGGWTSLAFALRWPERVERLVMCDTHGGVASDEINAAWAAALRTPLDLPPGVHPAAGARMAREQPDLAFLYAEIDALNPPRTREELGALLRAAGAPSLEDVARLAMPVLFVAGEEDTVIPPRILEIVAARVPGARLVRVPEAGHSVYFECATAFNAILDEFFSTTM